MTDTWDWDDYGLPNGIEIKDVCHTIKHGYGKGYNATRPGSTKMQKIFYIRWEAMTTEQWLNIVEFWRDQRGSANAFNWEFPESLYGTGGYGGYGGLEPADGFDQVYDTGFGGGPAFLVKFLGEELEQSRRMDAPGRWRVSAALIEDA